jgi:hypothetical protein
MFRANNIFSRPFSVGAALMCMVMLTAAPSAARPPHAEFLIDPVTGAILHSSTADATARVSDQDDDAVHDVRRP